MTKPINPAILGALVREGREAAGLTQTQLAERIGASRFWVAAFEKGKPSVELGLALKAIQALRHGGHLRLELCKLGVTHTGIGRYTTQHRARHCNSKKFFHIPFPQ